MTAPAGWYIEGNGQRYWDGANWTEHRAPVMAAQPWSGLSIASFCCGLFAIVFSAFPPIAVVLAVLGVVFMFVGLRDVKKRSARGTVLAVFGGVLGFLALQLIAFLLFLTM